MSLTTTSRRVQRVRHELRRREVRVRSMRPIGSGFVAITFVADSLADFVSDAFDDHVKFIVPDAAGTEIRRDYTPRSFDRDRREVTIEFAVHGGGQASAWARAAQPGMAATIAGPRGSLIVPIDHDWHLLAGDATAMPAIRRRLEELPGEAHTIVLLQGVSPADRALPDSRSRVELHAADDNAALLACLRGLQLPPGDGFAWAAGEATDMARLREVLLQEKAHPREATRIAAYWRRGASGFHETLEG